MKTTKRELKRIIAEEIKKALKEGGDVPFDVDPKSSGAKEGSTDPLEMLKRVKALVDKAIADLDTGGDLPGDASAEKEQVTRYPVTTKVDPSLDKPRPYSPKAKAALATLPKSYQ